MAFIDQSLTVSECVWLVNDVLLQNLVVHLLHINFVLFMEARSSTFLRGCGVGLKAALC